MERQQYRSVLTLIMCVMLILIFVFEMYAENIRKDIVEFELKNASESIVKYIDDNIDHINNLIASFYMPDSIQINEENMLKIQEYTRNWVECTNGLSAIYVISSSGKVYGYSSESVVNFNRFQIEEIKKLDVATSLEIRIFADEEKVGKLYFSKILLDKKNNEVGKVFFEYNLNSLMNLLEKLNSHLKNTNLRLLDSYGNELYNSDTMIETFNSAHNEYKDFEKVKEDNIRDTNIFKMNRKSILKYITKIYPETKAIEDNKKIMVESLTNRGYLKVILADTNFDILPGIETGKILLTIVLMIILCLFALVMSFCKEPKNRIIDSIAIYIITAFTFLAILILEVGYVNKLYDDYLCIQGEIISQSIIDSRSDIDNLAMLIVEIINNKTLYAKENEKNHITNFIMKIKENCRYIKNVEILSGKDNIFSYPNNLSLEQNEKIRDIHLNYMNDTNKSLRHVKNVEDEDIYILYYPYKKIEGKDNLIAITIKSKEYDNLRTETIYLTNELDYLNESNKFKEEDITIHITNGYKYIRKTDLNNSLGFVLIKDNHKGKLETYKLELTSVYASLIAFFFAVLMIIFSMIVVSCRIFVKYTKDSKKSDEEDELDTVSKLIMKAEKDIAKFNKDYGIKDEFE